MHRVVVTGLGIVAPNGNNVSESWENTVNGKSGIGPITAFDASDFPVRIAGEVKNFSLEEYIPAKEAKRMDPFIHYGLAASMQAIEDSGFAIEEGNAHRIGAIIGSGIGGLPGIEKGYESFYSGGSKKDFPIFCAQEHNQYGSWSYIDKIRPHWR